ncbi:MAG: energy transducer TonB [Elusimicrobia bacterium]|nr:energy transducer TonB [Elusimicrobiota bacterium]
MNQARVPASVLISLAFHAGFLVLFMGLVKEGPKQAAQIVEGVDLLIAPARPRPVEGTPKPVISTMDFLKMALPAAPRRAELAAVDVKLPETRKPLLAEAPKLEESTRRLTPKLEALDLARSRVSAAKIDAEPMSRRRAAQTLAALPKLEEVGRRRVKNLPEAIALEDKRREATTLLGGALEAPRATSRREVAMAAAKLEEAEAPAIAAPRKGLSVLPDQLVLRQRPETAIAPKFEKIAAAPKLERRQAAAATEGGPRKGVEIEGPLKDRKVVSAVIPKFPEWARTQGMMEAEVAIRFNVDADGAVMPGMRVERTSGYGRLDRLCMDSLRNWTFAPAPGSGAQWGVITFRFILE